MPGTYIAGKEGRVSFSAGAKVLNLRKWSINARVEDLVTTNFEDDGYATRIPGITEAEVSFEGQWDDAESVFASAPGLHAGNQLTEVRLYVDKTSTRYFRFPKLLVLTAQMSNDVNGVPEFSVSCKTNGIFYYIGE